MRQIEDMDLSAMVTQAVKGVTAGIAPHRGKAETEEYRCNVPVWLRNRNGLPADEVAAILSVERPELGIETEGDLYSMLAEGARQRRHGTIDYREGADTMSTDEAAKNFEAIEQFATALAGVDPKAVAAIRQAWKAAYSTAGHKALGRYLVSGDLALATKHLDKLTVN
jgi:hypothetical protein